MATFNNGESGLSVRNKLNTIINKVEGVTDIDNDINVDGVNITAIAATISDTAVDIFVYDTRKDSDGGAWRKRTQHTSWYNETLNTATRGSRKEFPSVAVIVAESDTVTIYDGDDPSLPMWMVFNEAGLGSLLGRTLSTRTSVAMLNGLLVSGGSYSSNHFEALVRVNLITDTGYQIDSSGTVVLDNNVSQRNQTGTYSIIPDGLAIVDQSSVNDVAMTVLPNAPIDAATGLPVPTIAVATNGGVSVIKDDGTVVDITESTGPSSTHAIEFTYDNKIVFMWSDTSGIDNYSHIGVIPIPSSDESSTYYYSSTFIEEDYSYQSAFSNFNEGPTVVPSTANTRDFKALSPNKSSGYDSGLSHVYSYPSDARKSMVAYTTSDYNTGWMNGDIKLATLSDTDDTDVTGSELSPALDFDVGANWIELGGAYVTPIDADSFTTTQGGAGFASQVFTSGLNETYVLIIEYDGGGLEARNGTSGSSSLIGASYSSGNQTIRATLVPSDYGNTNYLYLRAANGATYNINSVSVRLAEEDRSVNGNGLQVFGTVTKNPVATGADLVAYSGFSGTNYLRQPYNSDLDFGTGDFSIIAWVNTTAGLAAQVVIERGDDGVSPGNSEFAIAMGADETPYLQTTSTGGTGHNTAASGIPMPTGVWSLLVGVRRSNQLEMWVNGVLKSTADGASDDLTNTDAVTRVGSSNANGVPWLGSIALTRISGTAPSPEQIARIYNDEKHLFTEGAQATLYGSSDSVTALAFDDTTNLLHVGTSAGRSVFQGLRRVDNTTTAVTSAISASNGLVADE